MSRLSFILSLVFIATVTTAISFVLTSMVSDAGSFYENKPRPTIWSSEQDTVIVTWRIENAVGDWSRYDKLIYEILEDERGWQAAGIDFQQVYKTDDTDIVVRMYDRVREKPCEKDDELLRACAMNIGLYTIGRTIYLPAIRASDTFTFFVNHEFGHRLGFFHRDMGLMRPVFEIDPPGRVLGGPIWPTDTELYLLREMFESGRKRILEESE